MKNFEFLSSTKVIFGKDTENRVGELVAQYGGKRVLLHYGGGSIKRTGLYDRVMASLKAAGLYVIELGGVRPNPRLALVNEGIKLCREENIDFILAVGGGSAIDSAKAIGVGVPYDGDVWDFYAGTKVPEATLPVATINTIPAAGSETSKSSVITNENGMLKRGLNVNLIRPVFAIMNPELTYTLPPYQTAAGATDILAHIIERYFTNEPDVDLSDRLCEAVMQTVIKAVPKALAEPENYAARANIMYAASLAHNDLLEPGRVGDWSSHALEHELSAKYDVAHGAGLAIVIPAWMTYVFPHDIPRFVRFATCVMGVENDPFDQKATALAGIAALKSFFKSIGMPVALSEIGCKPCDFEELASKVKRGADGTTGMFMRLSKGDCLEIYKLAE